MRTRVISSEEFTRIFPGFRLDPDLVDALLAQAHNQSFPAGMHLYWEGDFCSGIAFMVSGTVRVYRCSKSGREITLYELGPGETCILNASSILGDKPYPANAVTLTGGAFVMIPAETFLRLFGSYKALQTMLFSLLSERLGDIMELVNEVAFRRMDERVMEYLLEKSDHGVVTTTHQKIASDLGTSREVVSRILKDFERQEKLLLTRNEIRLLVTKQVTSSAQ